MKAVGIILAGGKNERLGELTAVRASSAMPIGSCYRAIDFPISNMSNSGMTKIAVITQFNSRSLHDHLTSSKWWNLGSKNSGLFVFTPFLSRENDFWFRGTADSIYQNISFLRRSNEPYVIISSGESVYKFDFDEIIDYHIRREADITIAYKDASKEPEAGFDIHDFGVMELDENERMLDFEEKPVEPQSTIVSTGIYVMSRTLLIRLLETILPESRYDLVKDIIIRYRKKLKIYGYEFKSYWRTINSISSYYNLNMDFLNREMRESFLLSPPYIETKPKDEPPAKYNIGAEVKNTLVGSGSILNGFARHSVLFRKVFTGENSIVHNSIIMEGCFIGNNCVVENAILDKDVVLSDNKTVKGEPGKPVIVRKGIVI